MQTFFGEVLCSSDPNDVLYQGPISLSKSIKFSTMLYSMFNNVLHICFRTINLPRLISFFSLLVNYLGGCQERALDKLGKRECYLSNNSCYPVILYKVNLFCVLKGLHVIQCIAFGTIQTQLQVNKVFVLFFCSLCRALIDIWYAGHVFN